MTKHYHSTRSPLTLRAGALCITPDRDASAEYLDGEPGYRYEIRMTRPLRTARERDVRAAALAIDPEATYQRAWEMMEEIRGVVSALRADGFEAVALADAGPDNRTEHDTVTVFDALAAGLEIVACEEVA